MYITGTGANGCDLLEAVDDLLTVKLPENARWVRVYEKRAYYRNESRLCEAIWQGKGDGNDKIFINMRIPNVYNKDLDVDIVTNVDRIALDSSAGFDDGLAYYEQAGSIQQWLHSQGTGEVAQPMFTCLVDTMFTYWIFANAQRVIVVSKFSTVYESMYLGFINPVSSERQYPYPMYVAGNGVMTGATWNGNKNGSFINPSDGSGYLRRADGTWRAFDAYFNAGTVSNPFSIGTIFPYNTGNQKMVSNYYKGNTGDLDNALIIPAMLCTTNPYDINGVLDDVYFVSGTRDTATEQILSIGSEQYMVFSIKDYFSPNTYFVVKLV